MTILKTKLNSVLRDVIISRVALYQASVSGGTHRSVCPSVGLSVSKVYCGKTAEVRLHQAQLTVQSVD